MLKKLLKDAIDAAAEAGTVALGKAKIAATRTSDMVSDGYATITTGNHHVPGAVRAAAHICVSFNGAFHMLHISRLILEDVGILNVEDLDAVRLLCRKEDYDVCRAKLFHQE